MDEFRFIASLLAPLAEGEKGALALKDDAAVLQVPVGQELVITKDAMSAGVHFIGDEPPALIARKLLRVNLSDLAAMGAAPLGYFLALMLPEKTDEAWLTGFAEGLRQDQEEYGITLMGGDTTRIHGPLALSVTALGLIPQGEVLRRSGASAGDKVYVTGTLGDAALGLRMAKGKGRATRGEEYLIRRYRLPQPRVSIGQALCGIASACMDISDGVMQDVSHICEASGVGAEIHWSQIPLSEEARIALKEETQAYETVLAGGDDYELLFTVPEAKESRLQEIARACATPVTAIGRITGSMQVTVLDEQGEEIHLARKGYKHF